MRYNHFVFAVTVFSLFSFSLLGQVPKYKIYYKTGKKMKWEQVLDSTNKYDLVVFGEHHGDTLSYKFEYELLNYMSKNDSNLVFSLEMFERDNQIGLTQYIKGMLSERGFYSSVRIWPNYEKSYKGLLQLIKRRKLEILASNIPRRYASKVFHNGIKSLDSLEENEYSWICPLPFKIDTSLQVYRDVANLGMKGHQLENFLKAQAIKDATMGYFISQKLLEKKRVFHINGAFHSKYEQGVCTYVKEYGSVSDIFTIALVNQKKIKKLEKKNSNIADILIVKEDKPKSKK